jgi:glycerol-3-phosphate dehydrogenase
MAERTVDLCMRHLEEEEGRAFRPCGTQQLTLSGGEVRNASSFLMSLPQITVNYFGKHLLQQLYHRYGANAAGIAQEAVMREGPPAMALILAELEYGVRHEMVTELSDFLVRRTGRLYFAKAEGDLHAERLNRDLAELLGWNAEQAARSFETYRKESAEAVTFV